MKHATIALVIRYEGADPALVETLSDDEEIKSLEKACSRGDADPLRKVHDFRRTRLQEEEQFGNHVEDLLSQPFAHRDIREPGLKWLKSKMRIEQFQKDEAEAAKIIADYAYKLFVADPRLRDFSLEGPTATVRIKVFVIPSDTLQSGVA